MLNKLLERKTNILRNNICYINDLSIQSYVKYCTFILNDDHFAIFKNCIIVLKTKNLPIGLYEK